MEKLYQTYIYHILIHKNYRSILIAMTGVWLGLLIYDAVFFFNMDSPVSIIRLVYGAIVFLYTGFLSAASYTSLYERFHWQFHMTWAFLLTGDSIFSSIRDFLNYNSSKIEPEAFAVCFIDFNF